MPIFGNNSNSMGFAPSYASTPTKAAQASTSGPTTCTSSAPSMFLPSWTPQQKDTEPGVTVGDTFSFVFIVFLALFTRNFNKLYSISGFCYVSFLLNFMIAILFIFIFLSFFSFNVNCSFSNFSFFSLLPCINFFMTLISRY